MGFLDNFETKNPGADTKAVVNIEWVLKTLDAMLDANLTFTGIINVPTPPLPSE
jgi:hypothetical protein